MRDFIKFWLAAYVAQILYSLMIALVVFGSMALLFVVLMIIGSYQTLIG